MESAVFRTFCQSNHRAGWIFRAVSDTIDQDLPVPSRALFDLERQTETPTRLVGYLLRHPLAIPPFIRFLGALTLARERLAEGLIGLIDRL